MTRACATTCVRAFVYDNAHVGVHARAPATADGRVRSGPRATRNSRRRARIRARAQATVCEAWAARRSEGLRRPVTACGGAREFATIGRLFEELLRAPAMARNMERPTKDASLTAFRKSGRSKRDSRLTV